MASLKAFVGEKKKVKIVASCRLKTLGNGGKRYKEIRSYLDWLQSFKQFFINVSYNILVASLTLMGSVLKTEPPELDWLQVYYMTH